MLFLFHDYSIFSYLAENINNFKTFFFSLHYLCFIQVLLYLHVSVFVCTCVCVCSVFQMVIFGCLIGSSEHLGGTCPLWASSLDILEVLFSWEPPMPVCDVVCQKLFDSSPVGYSSLHPRYQNTFYKVIDLPNPRYET